ncbi:glycosyltransferase [Paenibacillus prosopidis]|uniref:Glycosyltransferase involved in cell wall biosynthesis n=1 Tax=Paenibacillus prosopidis TaxID=630520 RepID=A0A368VML7_9BACL|nr:glycosyltransferase [Paenibacillus prosopidis]RCW42724.1 glycosyltransferase involved in cell wall biosynthesis [Paenibacillus prosopidis]
MSKVSVIIPVYNAEKYIVECIQSLLNQTLQACEFIFVNDGSVDKSKSIIEDYQLHDGRIKLINQENQGVSAARNAGLQAALGEYVGFVDADDYIEKDMYETLYHAAIERNCDVVISNLESELEGSKVITTYPFRTNETLDRAYILQHIMPYLLKADDLNTAVNKIYRVNVLTMNKIAFPEKVALGEDGMFNMIFFGHAATMTYINYTGYHYREVSGSATRNIKDKDYFSKAIEVYITAPPQIYNEIIPANNVNRLKSIRLIKSMISYIYIYFKPSNDMSFKKRYRYVKQMITNKHVREALPIYWAEMNNSIGRYEKFILSMVKARSALGLMFAVAYSRLRNA